MNDLLSRLKIETELGADASLDPYALAGLFTRFRPDGKGMERMFGPDPVEQEVLARIRKVLRASGSSWKPGDMYVVLRKFDLISVDAARKLADQHLAGMEKLANYTGDTETERAISSLRRNPGVPAGEDIINTLVYDCLCDFLAEFQPSQDQLFLLKEAVYSIAADYYLMAYMLWPAIRKLTGLPDLLDPYFEMWRHGVELSGDGLVSIKK